MRNRRHLKERRWTLVQCSKDGMKMEELLLIAKSSSSWEIESTNSNTNNLSLLFFQLEHKQIFNLNQNSNYLQSESFSSTKINSSYKVRAKFARCINKS